MPADFFTRLRRYYEDVARVLRGESEVASVFPNTTDAGMSRERAYAELLRLHAPSKCNVFLGGFLFANDGSESKQLDVLVTTDTAPRFDFFNRDGTGKAFSPVEGTIAAFSIKTTLDKRELFDSLAGFASIPPTESLDQRISLFMQIPGYSDWPYKVIYASDGIRTQSLSKHFTDFYRENPTVPYDRRPNVIHVAGKYLYLRSMGHLTNTPPGGEAQTIPDGQYLLTEREPDVTGIAWVLQEIQGRAQSSTHILYNYTTLFNRMQGLPA